MIQYKDSKTRMGSENCNGKLQYIIIFANRNDVVAYRQFATQTTPKLPHKLHL